MQRYLFNHLSNTEFIILLMIVVLSIVFIMSFFAKKYFSSFMSYENNRFLAFFIASASTTYGFILGFTVVMLWRDLQDLRHLVTQEAEYLSLLVYNASAFPQAFQNELLGGVEQYITLVVQEEWPLMRLGKVSEKVVPTLSNLFHSIQSYTPETKVESSFYGQLINNLNKVIEFRRKRLEYIGSSLPEVIRFMFLFGLIVILFLLSLLDNESRKLKIISITLLCSMLSLNLFITLLLDYPFTGLASDTTDPFSVNSEPFTKGILERFNPENKEKKMIPPDRSVI